MNNKDFVKYFLIISILIISFIPSFNFIILGKEIEKKNLYSIDNFQGYINYKIYKIFNSSMIPGQVIVGKDDFLFLGNDYAKVLHKTNGIYRPSNEEINNWTNKLKDLQKWYEDRGIKFVIVIAPNKHSIYKEKLPDWMRYDGKTITDDIVEQSNLKNINILDLREELAEARKEELDILYWKTDTHWNEKGASIAFNTIINKINNIYQLNIEKPKYDLIQASRGGGDLANFLKINTILKKDYEKSYNYKFDKNYNICKGNINKENHTLGNCEEIFNPIMGINSQPQYMINKDSENNLRLLFLCDSFGTAPSQLYNATFKEIYKFHYNHINGQKLVNFVEKTNPDLIIYQVVERQLYDESIVSAMPNIFHISTENINLENSIFDILKDKYSKNDHLELLSENNNIKLNAIKNDPIIILNQTKANSKNVILSYEVESNIDTTFQLFYKKEATSNYNEGDSYRLDIKKGNNKINLLIPSEYINNSLRVDLVSTLGSYDIKSFRIYDK